MPRCPSCGKGFKSKSSVAMHMGQPHSGCNTWINNLVHIHESLHTEIPTSADQDFDSIDMDVKVEHSVDPSNPTIAFQPPSMDSSSSDMPTIPWTLLMVQHKHMDLARCLWTHLGATSSVNSGSQTCIIPSLPAANWS